MSNKSGLRTNLFCPACGELGLTKLRTKTQAGKTRYRCTPCGERTCYPLREPKEPKYTFLTEIKRAKRYVVTCAQNATPVNRRSFNSLLVYCKENDAYLIVIPVRYKNPTSVWLRSDKDDDWWAPEVMPYLFTGRADINENLMIMGDIKIRPTTQSPLSGFESISGEKSAIFGHPKVALKTIATPQNALPKMLWTTGCVTKENYVDCAAGKKGEFHHSFGALVVERVDDKMFFVRQLSADSTGRFFDIAGGVLKRYSQDGVEDWEGCAGLVMGDTHVDFRDEQVARATFGAKGLVAVTTPKNLVWHDLIDSYSISHHHRKKPFTQFAKRQSGMDRVREEVVRAFNYVRENTPKGARSIIVPSNHLDHIHRWIEEQDWRQDPTNAEFYLETALDMVRGTKMTGDGADYPDPVTLWGKRMLPESNFVFPTRGQDFIIKTISVGNHGDEGVDGARGSLGQFSKIGVKTVTGHTHRPGIDGGAWSVGTNGTLTPEYVGALSSWFHTDCIIYDNGKRALINFINGRFCL